ncbi:hypothetical protein ACSBL2_19305 [Pedobacter sp. AW31-3R]|uniref:hypothetical protein n=1 Tax=Pedobacter sp. AW31-3R TaxID=3445781 RepID=UPI003F9F8D9C
MNKEILDKTVQEYICAHLNADVHQVAMAKSPFAGITGPELSNQIAAKKKCIKKLPVWFNTANIYYPPLLSVEQCSSEVTAAYKAGLATGDSLIDLTGGYGVDSYYFSKTNTAVTHCEINAELSGIARYNSTLLDQDNTRFLAVDGIRFLKDSAATYQTIYIDPARRSSAGKVFMLKDCTPDVIENLDLLLSKSARVMIKTAPLLDLSAGLRELRCVEEIHIVSVKNECKELIWILKEGYDGKVRITSTTLNTEEKHFSFLRGEEVSAIPYGSPVLGHFLYEPDVALLKSGAFELIAETYGLHKLDHQTQLYVSSEINTAFPGRIFRIEQLLSSADLKKDRTLVGNVIVRNYPAEAAGLVKKFKIKPDDKLFMVFTQTKGMGKMVIKGTIIQHY